MHPDLIARTCGSIGVLGALVFVGVIDSPKFIITPSQNFESVLLSINVVQNTNTQEEIQPTNEPVNEVEAEPTQNPPPPSEPVSEPKPVEPPPTINENNTDVIKVEEPLPPTPIKEEPKIKEKPSVKTPPKNEPKIEKPKNTETKINKAQAEAKAKAKAQAEAKAKAQAQAAKEAKEAQEKSLLETSNRKLNAQLASLLVKEIRSKLRYPRNAVRRKLEGTVMVEFVIQNGVVTSYKIEKSSGHKILDEAASKLAKSLVKFNTRLDAMSNKVLIPIKYELI